MVFLRDVLREMRDGMEPFHLVYYTADLQRGTGGERKEYGRCLLHRTAKKRTAKMPSRPTVRHRKNPQHDQHETINVLVLPDKKIRKVHIRLIKEFNHEKVIW